MRLDVRRADPLVSVIVTTFNQAEYIEATVLSALDQTYARCEIVVVDDGSTDGTAERLAPFRDRIRYIRQDNQGVAGSRNTGIRHAKGELLAFLEGDDLWEPEKIAYQVEAYKAHPNVGLIAVDSCEFSGSTVLRKSAFPWSDVSFSRDGRTASGRFHRHFLEQNLIWTTSQAMVPARVFAAIGLSDKRFSVCSDYDLYIRIAAAYDIVFLTRVLTRWRYLPTSGFGPIEVRRLRQMKDDVAVLKKHLKNASPKSRSIIRKTLQRTVFEAARAAYDRGSDMNRAEWGRYLTQLWVSHPTDCWPLVFRLGLSSPPKVRRLAAAMVAPLLRTAA